MNDVTHVKEHMGEATSVVLTDVDTPVNVVLVSARIKDKHVLYLYVLYLYVLYLYVLYLYTWCFQLGFAVIYNAINYFRCIAIFSRYTR